MRPLYHQGLLAQAPAPSRPGKDAINKRITFSISLGNIVTNKLFGVVPHCQTHKFGSNNVPDIRG